MIINILFFQSIQNDLQENKRKRRRKHVFSTFLFNYLKSFFFFKKVIYRYIRNKKYKNIHPMNYHKRANNYTICDLRQTTCRVFWARDPRLEKKICFRSFEKKNPIEWSIDLFTIYQSPPSHFPHLLYRGSSTIDGTAPWKEKEKDKKEKKKERKSDRVKK